MLFDKLCGLADRYFADGPFRQMIEGCALIKLPDHMKRIEAGVHDIFTQFFLPLPVVCIESTGLCAIFSYYQQVDPSQPGIQKGDALQVVLLRDLTVLSEATSFEYRVNQDIGGNLLEVLSGFFEVWSQEDEQGKPGWQFQLSGLSVGWGNKKIFKSVGTWEDEMMVEAANAANETVEQFKARVQTLFHENVIKGMLQLHAINSPGNWVVEERGTENVKREPTKSKKIRRSHQRPRLLVITDKERVRYTRRDETTEKRTSPLPHARRAHWRKVGTDESTGRPVYTRVRASWVGGKEVSIGGTTYEVRTDL